MDRTSINPVATIAVAASYLRQRPTREPAPVRAVTSRMSIFAHPHAVAASEPKKKCANCHHLEVIIADLQAWVEDLRESRDHWRELALNARDLALDAERIATERAAAEAA